MSARFSLELAYLSEAGFDSTAVATVSAMDGKPSSLADVAERYIDRHGVAGDQTNGDRHFEYAAAGGLILARCQIPTEQDCSVYEPLACLIIQGVKEVVVGEEVTTCNPGDIMIGSHDLPVRTRIAAASTDHPYLVAILPLDIAEIRGLYDQVGRRGSAADPASSSLTAEPSSDELINAFERYLLAIDGQLDEEVVAPLIAKEIHYRLLTSPSGGMLRSLLLVDSHASRIAEALARIRLNFRQPQAVAELAEMVGLSVSSFHEHFKAVTGTTPLQYQKDLRLIEARRDMAADASLSASEAGHRVGYRSPTQFSREYARKFGAPPGRDTVNATRASE